MEGCMKTFINLLPPSFQRQMVLRRRAVQWGAVLVGGLLVGGVVRWSDVRIHDKLVQRLDLLSREHQPTQKMLQQLVEMRQELDELQQQEQIAQELEHQRPALTLLGILTDIGERTSGSLRITKLELIGLQHSTQVADTPTSDSSESQVVLTGESLDNQSIATLVSGLNESGYFTSVELLNSTELGEDSNIREYQVRCKL
jgi:Tfp pilus assembly protein PilN